MSEKRVKDGVGGGWRCGGERGRKRGRQAKPGHAVNFFCLNKAPLRGR